MNPLTTVNTETSPVPKLHIPQYPQYKGSVSVSFQYQEGLEPQFFLPTDI